MVPLSVLRVVEVTLMMMVMVVSVARMVVFKVKAGMNSSLPLALVHALAATSMTGRPRLVV